MRVILAALFTVVPALSQNFTLSTTLPNFTSRLNFPVPYPQEVVVSGSGTFSVAAGVCTGLPGGSVVYSNTLTGTQSGTITGTVGTNNIWIAFNGYDIQDAGLSAATYSCTSVVTGTSGSTCNSNPTCTISYNLVLDAPSVPILVGSEPSNCSATTYNFFYANCTVPNSVPGGTFSPPNAGGSYTDATFGTTITSLTWPAVYINCGDVIVSTTNLGGELTCGFPPSPYGNTATTLFASTANNGSSQPIGTAIYVNIPPEPIFSGTDPYTAWHFNNNLTISKTVYVHPAPSVPCSTGGGTCWTDSVVYTDPAPTGATSISNADDGDITGDNWICFGEAGGSPNRIGMVNLNTGQDYYGNFPADWISGNIPSRNTQATVVDPSNGYRYCVVSSFGNYTVAIYHLATGGSGLVFDGYLAVLPDAYTGQGNSPQTPYWGGNVCSAGAVSSTYNACLAIAHSSVGFDGTGVPYMFNAAVSSQQPYTVQMVAMKLNVGPSLMLTPHEAGGGLYALGNVGGQDYHAGCAKTHPVCFITQDFTGPQITVQITGATNTNPITITTNPAYSGSNGDSVLIHSVLGNTAANGVFTISGLSGTTFTIPVAGNGVYASGGGLIQNISTNFSADAYPVEAQIIDLTNINAVKVTRLLQHRSVPTGGYLGGYYGQGHGSISGDGTQYVYESNMGYPDGQGMFIAPTGYVAPNTIPGPVGSAGTVSGAGAVIR